MFAYNYRMTNIEAAFLYDQLNNIDNILKNKYLIFKNYDNLFNKLVKINKIELFKNENDTEFSPWLYGIRIKDDNTDIQKKMLFFEKKNIDIRPFFYPINTHTHLKNIKNTDEISCKLNKEIFMIPSSSNITYNQQFRVYKRLIEYLIYILDITIIEVNKDNKNDIYDIFLSTIHHPYFTYFKNRAVTCIDNHILTIVLNDNKTNKFIGYAHIDYNNLYWFGIYIDPEYQSIKLGELLLKYVLSHEKVNNISTISLAVDKNNYAIRLYENNNFKIVKENDKNYFMELNK